MRIGLFGGTFNPIHHGHVKAARQVMLNFGLDHVCFIPCAIPPHKLQSPLAPAAARLEMIRLALATSSRMMVSDVEIRRTGPSYTVDTMRHFKSTASTGDRIFFLLGLDAFLEIHTWKAFQTILDHATLIVMARPIAGMSRTTLQKTAGAYARQHLSDDYQLSGDGSRLRHPNKQPIFLAGVTPMEIASSQIRKEILHGGNVDKWVDSAVAQYIDRKGLYQ